MLIIIMMLLLVMMMMMIILFILNIFIITIESIFPGNTISTGDVSEWISIRGCDDDLVRYVMMCS